VLLLARGCRDVTARGLLCGRLFANGPEESKSDDVLMAALRFVAVPRGFDALFESLLVDMAIVRVLRLSKALRQVFYCSCCKELNRDVKSIEDRVRGQEGSPRLSFD
jgi:hypothetical protein